MPNDDVRLVIGGKDFVGWTEVSINMAVDQMADSFSLSSPFDPEFKDLVAAIQPYKYQPVKILIGDDVYLTGTLDLSGFSCEPSSRVVTLQGRSITGILADCSTDADDTAQMTDLIFAQIARKVAGKLGVSIRDDDSKSATRTIPEARAEFGESAFDFLHKLAAPHNLLLNSSFDGKLVLTFGDDLASYPLRAELEEGDPFIRSIATSFDSSKRFSSYKVASQFAGAPDIMGSASDPDVKPYRPKYKAVEEADEADPDGTAARMMAEAIASSFSISVSLSGWRRPDGGRWSERQIVTLKAPGANLPKASRHVIAGCSLRLDADGYSTELRLVPPEVYSSTYTKAKKKKVDLW